MPAWSFHTGLHNHLAQPKRKKYEGKWTCDLKYQISSAPCGEQKICFCTNSVRIYNPHPKVSSKWASVVACLWNFTQFPSKLFWYGVTSPASPPPKASERKHTPTYSRAAACMLYVTCSTETSHVLWNTTDVFRFLRWSFWEDTSSLFSFVPPPATQTPHMQFHLTDRGRENNYKDTNNLTDNSSLFAHLDQYFLF